jgi:hypothetical protein
MTPESDVLENRTIDGNSNGWKEYSSKTLQESGGGPPCARPDPVLATRWHCHGTAPAVSTPQAMPNLRHSSQT